jgi:hypothetical protein
MTLEELLFPLAILAPVQDTYDQLFDRFHLFRSADCDEKGEARHGLVADQGLLAVIEKQVIPVQEIQEAGRAER